MHNSFSLKKCKNIKYSFLGFILLFTLVFPQKVKSQEVFIIGHLNPYFEQYVQPFARAMAVSMSGGWVHTAQVHKTLGIDISVGASYVNIPPSELTFNPEHLGIDGYVFQGTSAPTISSSQYNNLPTIKKIFLEGLPFGFKMDVLEGLNLSFGAMAQIQMGIGLPKGTDLLFRFTPDVSNKLNGFIPFDIQIQELRMFGVGAKHDLKQWIPYVKDLPYLHLSVMGGYSGFRTHFAGDDLKFDPEMLGVESTLPEEVWDYQKLKIDMGSFVGTFLIGADFKYVQPFFGWGFSSSVFEAKFAGNYPVVRFSLLNTDGIIRDFETDPLKTRVVMEGKNYQAGLRLKLWYFALYYSYNFQRYGMHNAGVVLTIR